MRALETTKDPRGAMQLQTLCLQAGLQNVESRMMVVPLSPWQHSKLQHGQGSWMFVGGRNLLVG